MKKKQLFYTSDSGERFQFNNKVQQCPNRKDQTKTV